MMIYSVLYWSVYVGIFKLFVLFVLVKCKFIS